MASVAIASAGELAGGRERGIAGIGLVEPGLRGGAIGRRQRLQFAPRLGEIVAQRRRRDPRDHAPRSLPTASLRSMRTSLAAPACSRSTMPVPVVELSGAGGDNFGTSVSNSRFRLLALGTPEAAKPSSGFNASGFGASAFAAAIAAG